MTFIFGHDLTTQRNLEYPAIVLPPPTYVTFLSSMCISKVSFMYKIIMLCGCYFSWVHIWEGNRWARVWEHSIFRLMLISN